MYGEGVIRGGLIALVDVVDELLHAHGVLVGEVAVIKEPAGQRLEIWPESGLSRRAFIIGVNKRSEG